MITLTPESGLKVLDDTIVVGTSPGTSESVFTTPEDAGFMDILDAEKFIEELNRRNAYGHNDWRLPDDSEKQTLLSLENKGALAGTFNKHYRSISSCYLSSDDLTRETLLLERARDRFRVRVDKNAGVKFFIRPVRSGPMPA